MRRTPTIFNAYDILARPEFYRGAAAEVPAGTPGVPAPPQPPEGGYLGLAPLKVEGTTQRFEKGWWVPARPLGPSWDRWRAVWLVLTGRADVLHWPGQER